MSASGRQPESLEVTCRVCTLQQAIDQLNGLCQPLRTVYQVVIGKTPGLGHMARIILLKRLQLPGKLVLIAYLGPKKHRVREDIHITARIHVDYRPARQPCLDTGIGHENDHNAGLLQSLRQ